MLPIVERSPAVDVDSDVEVVEPRTVFPTRSNPWMLSRPFRKMRCPRLPVRWWKAVVPLKRRRAGNLATIIQATEPQPAASDVTESVAAAPLPAEQAPSVRSSTVVETP